MKQRSRISFPEEVRGFQLDKPFGASSRKEKDLRSDQSHSIFAVLPQLHFLL